MIRVTNPTKLPSKKQPSRNQALEAVKTLLAYIGEDPQREGLIKTPERVIRAWEQDWGVGYNKKFVRKQTLSILGAQFNDGAESYNTMIVQKKIRFTSHCEHHLAPFSGTVAIGYIPSSEGRILGLSKLTRVVNLFSRRLQVQERMTTQIADFIQIHCKPLGIGVVIKATHGCMCSRGVRQHDTKTITSALRGEMLTKQEVREEFLSFVR